MRGQFLTGPKALFLMAAPRKIFFFWWHCGRDAEIFHTFNRRSAHRNETGPIIRNMLYLKVLVFRSQPLVHFCPYVHLCTYTHKHTHRYTNTYTHSQIERPTHIHTQAHSNPRQIPIKSYIAYLLVVKRIVRISTRSERVKPKLHTACFSSSTNRIECWIYHLNFPIRIHFIRNLDRELNGLA